jgi:O-antigen/teichoic acid export membrane protein
MIATLFYVIPRSISTSLFAEGSFDEKTLEENVKKAIKLITFLTIPAIIGLILISDKLLSLFSKAYAENATQMLWILGIAAIPVAINSLFITIRRIQKKIDVVIWVGASIAIGTLTLSYLLLGQMGLVGIGLAWLISQGLVAIAIARKLTLNRYMEYTRRNNNF